MAKARLKRLLSHFAEVQPGEETISILIFFYFFLITAPYGIIKSIRNAAFLDQVGARWLPLAVLVTAVSAALMVSLHSRLQTRVARPVMFIGSLVFFVITACVFFFLFSYGWKWLPFAYWVWANIFVVVLTTQFWITVNDIFNPREVKRLVGIFVSGGILGGIAGNELAAWLSKSNQDFYLLFFAAAMLVACGFVLHSIFSWLDQKKGAAGPSKLKAAPEAEEKSRVGFNDCFQTIKKNSYLLTLTAIVALTQIVSALIDQQFNTVVEGYQAVQNNLISFFGHFNAGLLAFSFIFQVFLTPRIIKNFGIRFSLFLYPLILLLCSFGIALSPVILAAIGLKGSDKSLSYSLNQSVRELLYIPISPEVKYKAKIFIDVFINRTAKGVGALLLTILVVLLGVKILVLSVITILFILAWTALNWRVGLEYIGIVKDKLKLKWERGDRLVADKIDVDYAKLVFDTVESKNRSSVLYAMHLFDLIKLDKLTPEVKRLLSQKSDEMKLSSLGSLFEADEAVLGPETEDSLEEGIIQKEIEEIMSLDVYKQVMGSYIDKALQGQGQEIETTKMEVAKALGLMNPKSPLIDKLEDLLADSSPEVTRYAVQSAAVLKRRDDAPALIQMLRSPLLREDAMAALENYGSKITGMLADYLGDPREDLEVRKGTAAVLARISTPEAADFLLWQLAVDKGDLQFELIDALDKIRSEKDGVSFPGDIIQSKIMEEIRRHYELFLLAAGPEWKGEVEKAGIDMRNELDLSMMNIFSLLGLIYPREDMVKAYQNLKTGTKESVAYAVELVDNSLKKEVKDYLLPIIEDIPPKERIRRIEHLLKIIPSS